MRLTKNFELSEFLINSKGIDLHPSDTILLNINYLVNITLQPMRDFFNKPIVITSGYRDENLNKLIGGAKYSSHLSGRAVDFHIIKDGISRMPLWTTAFKIYEYIPFTQLIIYPEEIRYHIETDNENFKKEVLIKGVKEYINVSRLFGEVIYER